MRPAFRLDRPPSATAATRRLRALIFVTAVATVAVDLVNLEYSPEPGFGLAVRTVWAILRAIGFLFLAREVRFGRLSARPFGVILSATTVFAVARLAQPREHGYLPHWPVLLGLAILMVLCGTIIWQLYRSPAIDAHLTRRPPRRHIPPWVLTARVAALSYAPLLMIPCLVAIGSLFGTPRVDRTIALPVIFAWLGFAVVGGTLTSIISLIVLYGKRWARVLLAGISMLVLAGLPTLCWFLLGPDGLIRDGAPMVVAALLCLAGLWRSRRNPGGARLSVATTPGK
jgi:hypothetical protein